MSNFNADTVTFRLIDDEPGKVGLEITDGENTTVVSGTVSQLRAMANRGLSLPIPRSAYQRPPEPEPSITESDSAPDDADWDDLDPFEQEVVTNSRTAVAQGEQTNSLLGRLVDAVEGYFGRFSR